MEEYDNNISIGSIPCQDDDAMNDIEIDQDDNDLIDDGSTGNLGNGAEDTESGLEKFKNKKRSKRSEVWKICTELKVKGEQRLAMCNICKKTFKLHSTSSTTQLGRHVKKCKAENGLLSQKILQFTPSGTESNKLETFKYDHALMRKTVAEFTLINELPFSLVDSLMFNKMMSSATPFWQKITRQMVKQDCISFYEIEKAKLMDLLRLVDRVCITTDMWTSDHQKLGYMVVTGHWIDSSWSLHSRVLNFYNIPPPHSGLVISEELLMCFREWGIQDKIGSITVDNAKNNDVALTFIKDNFNFRKKLSPMGSKLIHTRCAAHIINLLVQNGLKPINHTILCVRDGVKYITQTEGRLIKFAAISKELNLSGKKLVLDNNTRWNSTFKMLVTAIEFKAVFPEYRNRERGFDYVPSDDEWGKVQDVCDFLEVFNIITNILSGTSYPTANLLLPEVWRIKEVINEKLKSLDDDIKLMAEKMNKKFDKYWGGSNLTMSLASVLDPRFKFKLIDYCFPVMYTDVGVANKKIDEVQSTLRELFAEYVSNSKERASQVVTSSSSNSSHSNEAANQGQSAASGMFKFRLHMSQTNAEPEESELDTYLKERAVNDVPGQAFDALEWWKANSFKYKVLSQLASNILSIPITTVASESTFSAGSRVIDPYRASLKPETVQVLLCGADWAREANGLKKKQVKSDDKIKEQVFQFPNDPTPTP